MLVCVARLPLTVWETVAVDSGGAEGTAGDELDAAQGADGPAAKAEAQEDETEEEEDVVEVDVDDDDDDDDEEEDDEEDDEEEEEEEELGDDDADDDAAAAATAIAPLVAALAGDAVAALSTLGVVLLLLPLVQFPVLVADG